MADRRRAERFGKRAEAWVATWLRLKGFRVLARNFRVGPGEIDIIATRGGCLVFVEVKAREDGADLGFFRPRQRRRIERAAQAFLAAHPALTTRDCRFDLVVVSPWRWPRHLEGAWRLNE